MTLEALKNSWAIIATGHTGITSFQFGESFDTNKYPDTEIYYPLFFLELPYSIQYGDTKNISFAIVVLYKNVFDDPLENHKLISKAESIADSILQMYDLANRSKFFRIDTANGISLDRYTDDQTCGIRVEINGIAKRYCYDINDFQ